MRVSAIVRARDEAEHLPEALRRLRNQNHPSLEIVVVDSGSTDGTLAIAEAEADVVVHIEPEEFTFGRSLNRGCEAASGELFAILSAHAYPASNNWLGNLVAPFANPDVGMVYGRQLPYERSRIGEARDFERTFPLGSHVLLDLAFGNNANAAVRAELWREHPYDEELTGLEDIEMARFVQRRGFAVHYAANASIVHIHDESVPQIYRRFFREGLAWAELVPHGRRSGATAAIKAAADLIRDLRFARRSGAGRSAVAGIPGYRLAAALGAFRGERSCDRRREERAGVATRGLSGRPRAVRIDGPGNAVLHETEAREPGAGEAIVRVAYVGVCATDVEILEAEQAYYANGVAEYPIVPGHEFSGVVEAVGAGADPGLVGARVVGECILGCGECDACRQGGPAGCEGRREVGVLRKDGAYATQVTMPLGALHAVPPGLPLLYASLAEPIAVINKALRKVPELRGRRCAVVGAGPIGHLSALVLRDRGAEALVIDLDEGRLEPLRKMDFSTAGEITEEALADREVVIEATGSEAALGALAVAPAASTVLAVGRPGADGAAPPAAPANGGARFIGTLGSDPVDWPEAIGLLGSGRLSIHMLTQHVADLADYNAAWEAVRDRSRLKTILSVDRALAHA